MNKNPEKFAIEFIIRNGHKLEEERNRYLRGGKWNLTITQ